MCGGTGLLARQARGRLPQAAQVQGQHLLAALDLRQRVSGDRELLRVARGEHPAALARDAHRHHLELGRVERPEDIRPALDKALSSNSPAVVEVVSDVDAMSKRAWRP